MEKFGIKVQFHFANQPTCCCILPLCLIVVDRLCYGNYVACHLLKSIACVLIRG